ncbi:MAG TPA: universal stress protein [Gemmatimonadales bacterium]|nr:universal stress protein [Gemmatimonadales bacterium]
MYKRFLVPLDGSKTAEAILPFVLEIAGPLDIEVALVRVVVPIPPSVIEGSREVVVEDVEARRAEAERYLDGLAAELRDRGVRVRTMVRRGDPAVEIAAAARELEADLVAMTTHGRSGLGRLLFGSVAEAVLRTTELPVLMMRQTAAQVAQRGRA